MINILNPSEHIHDEKHHPLETSERESKRLQNELAETQARVEELESELRDVRDAFGQLNLPQSQPDLPDGRDEPDWRQAGVLDAYDLAKGPSRRSRRLSTRCRRIDSKVHQVPRPPSPLPSALLHQPRRRCLERRRPRQRIRRLLPPGRVRVLIPQPGRPIEEEPQPVPDLLQRAIRAAGVS